MNSTDYGKLLNQIRTQFLALMRADDRYADCLKMLEFARGVHQGVRKDGVTQEFYHQLSIVGILLTQHRNLENPHLVYQAALAHDIGEDYPEHWSHLKSNFPDVYDACWTLSKVRNGEIVPYKQYFAECGRCPIASAVKLVDRMHNLSTMAGVFTPEKMARYSAEVEEYFLPMAKQARTNFPRQRDFYELTKSVVIDTTNLVNHFVGAEKKKKNTPESDLALG